MSSACAVMDTKAWPGPYLHEFPCDDTTTGMLHRSVARLHECPKPITLCDYSCGQSLQVILVKSGGVRQKYYYDTTRISLNTRPCSEAALKAPQYDDQPQSTSAMEGGPRQGWDQQRRCNSSRQRNVPKAFVCSNTPCWNQRRLIGCDPNMSRPSISVRSARVWDSGSSSAQICLSQARLASFQDCRLIEA